MIWISNSTLGRLRDQLRLNGQRTSVVETRATVPDVEADRVLVEYGPLCEAMYLMMTADGSVSEDEREVLRGALRNLSGDVLGRAELDALLLTAARNVAVDGRDARLQAVTSDLASDDTRAEVAYVLAAAIAFADNAIADAENTTLDAFAAGLGIDEARAETLLASVQRDLEGDRSTRGS